MEKSSLKSEIRLISASGGRFPRAWLDQQDVGHAGVVAGRDALSPPTLKTPGSSAQAIPAGVAAFRFNQRK